MGLLEVERLVRSRRNPGMEWIYGSQTWHVRRCKGDGGGSNEKSLVGRQGRVSAEARVQSGGLCWARPRRWPSHPPDDGTSQEAEFMLEMLGWRVHRITKSQSVRPAGS